MSLAALPFHVWPSSSPPACQPNTRIRPRFAAPPSVCLNGRHVLSHVAPFSCPLKLFEFRSSAAGLARRCQLHPPACHSCHSHSLIHSLTRVAGCCLDAAGCTALRCSGAAQRTLSSRRDALSPPPPPHTARSGRDRRHGMSTGMRERVRGSVCSDDGGVRTHSLVCGCWLEELALAHPASLPASVPVTVCWLTDTLTD
jgi:hypothetical protein